MTYGVCIVYNLGLTTLAVVGCITLSRTGRLGYNRVVGIFTNVCLGKLTPLACAVFINVINLISGLVTGNVGLTNGTPLACAVSAILTGRSYRRMSLGGMTAKVAVGLATDLANSLVKAISLATLVLMLIGGIEYDLVNRATCSIRNGSEANSLINRCINLNSNILTIICRCRKCYRIATVNSDLRGLCLISCYINVNFSYVFRNSEAHRAYQAVCSKLKASIAFSVKSAIIYLACVLNYECVAALGIFLRSSDILIAVYGVCSSLTVLTELEGNVYVKGSITAVLTYTKLPIVCKSIAAGEGIGAAESTARGAGLVINSRALARSRSLKRTLCLGVFYSKAMCCGSAILEGGSSLLAALTGIVILCYALAGCCRCEILLLCLLLIVGVIKLVNRVRLGSAAITGHNVRAKLCAGCIISINLFVINVICNISLCSAGALVPMLSIILRPGLGISMLLSGNNLLAYGHGTTGLALCTVGKTGSGTG